MSSGNESMAVAEWSLVDALATVRRHRRLVLGLPGIALVLVVGISLVLPRVYESSAAFMPQSTDATRSRLAGLAAQFGVTVPLGEAGQSLGFYADLLESREILDSVILHPYQVESGGQELSGTLIDILKVKGASDGERLEAANKRVKDNLRVDPDPAAGLVRLSLRTRWPGLSQAILDQILAQVNEFNLRRRQSQAGAERGFIELRMADSKNGLREAENSLQDFLQRNREYRNSPLLNFQYDRLSREVSLRQQVYTGLAQSYEQARIEEVRNTPVITTVEHPSLPARPASRKLAFKGLAALLIGGMLGLSLAFARDLTAAGAATST